MANPKGNPQNLKRAGKGRPKGAKNKFTDLKSAFLNAFEKIGGEEGLASWARDTKNRGAFYHMITKLFPKRQEIPEEKEDWSKVEITHKYLYPNVDSNSKPTKKENKI